MTYFSRHSFGKVLKVNKDNVEVQNIDGFKWTVSKEIFEQEFHLNDAKGSEQIVSRTQLIDIVDKNSYTIMTVTFAKQPKEADVRKKLHALYPNKGNIISETDFKLKCNNILNEVMKGESRVLIGYHTGNKDASGRYYFNDMETITDEKKRPELRLVDPRTLESVIVKDVEYTLQ